MNVQPASSEPDGWQCGRCQHINLLLRPCIFPPLPDFAYCESCHATRTLYWACIACTVIHELAADRLDQHKRRLRENNKSASNRIENANEIKIAALNRTEDVSSAVECTVCQTHQPIPAILFAGNSDRVWDARDQREVTQQQRRQSQQDAVLQKRLETWSVPDEPRTEKEIADLFAVVVQGGDVDAVRSMLQSHAWLLNRAGDHGETPLMMAAVNARSNVVDLLLKQHANPEARHHAGWTVLDHKTEWASDVFRVLFDWEHNRRRSKQFMCLACFKSKSKDADLPLQAIFVKDVMADTKLLKEVFAFL